MTSRIRNPKDFWTGAIFMAVGGAAVLLARDYPLGTSFKMGPGYFPTVLGALLALVGLITVLRGLLRPGTAVGALAYREILLVLTATVLFGVLLRGAGLVVAVVLLVMVSAYASRYFRWGTAVALAAGMSAFCVLVFVKALGLPIPMLGPWFGQ
jgi:putative tricarboxylic transport membrane protein